LQKAQRLAAEVERQRPQKRKRYDGKFKSTLKRHKRYQRKLEKEGFPSVLKYFTPVKRTNLEGAPKELDICLMSKCTAQVYHRDVLMYRGQ